jgi:hypothetical protein
VSALNHLTEQLHQGPQPPVEHRAKGLRGLVRRLLLRAMRPYIAYQEQVNVGLVNVLAEQQEAIRASTLTEATLLAEVRRLQRELRDSQRKSASG